MQEPDVAVMGAELTEIAPGQAALRAELNWGGTPLSVAVEVRM